MTRFESHWRCEEASCESYGVFHLTIEVAQDSDLPPVEIGCPLCSEPMHRLDDPLRKVRPS